LACNLKSEKIQRIRLSILYVCQSITLPEQCQQKGRRGIDDSKAPTFVTNSMHIITKVANISISKLLLVNTSLKKKFMLVGMQR
jgi:hypothetical protein